MSYGLSEAERELRDLAAKIAELQKLQDRYNKVAQFVQLGKQLSGQDNGKNDFTADSPEAPAQVKTRAGWEEFAAGALANHSDGLYIDRLLEQMRSLGWSGSGDEKRDRHNIGVNLTRNQRFRNLGNNTWTLATVVARQRVLP
jgi:hypothetical protein